MHSPSSSTSGVDDVHHLAQILRRDAEPQTSEGRLSGSPRSAQLSRHREAAALAMPALSSPRRRPLTVCGTATFGAAVSGPAVAAGARCVEDARPAVIAVFRADCTACAVETRLSRLAVRSSHVEHASRIV